MLHESKRKLLILLLWMCCIYLKLKEVFSNQIRASKLCISGQIKGQCARLKMHLSSNIFYILLLLMSNKVSTSHYFTEESNNFGKGHTTTKIHI